VSERTRSCQREPERTVMQLEPKKYVHIYTHIHNNYYVSWVLSGLCLDRDLEKHRTTKNAQARLMENHWTTEKAQTRINETHTKIEKGHARSPEHIFTRKCKHPDCHRPDS